MSLAARVNRPGLVRWVWKPLYELGYLCLKWAAHFICGQLWRVRRIGPRPAIRSGGVVFCANHASYLDPAFLQIVLRRRVTFVMTENFYRLRWGRWFFGLVGAVPIGRGRLARRGLRRAMALVRRGHAIALFPEGRLSVDGRLNHAQRGIGTLARRTGAPVIPVGIAGSIHAWGKGQRRPGRACVRILFGEPLRYAGEAGASKREAEQAFADALMARIARLKAVVQSAAPDFRDAPVAFAPLQRAGASGR